MTDLPVYSPTETEDYLVCPRYRVLKRSLRPRTAPLWTPHLALGIAIHEGLATHYGGNYPDPARQAEALADALLVLNREYRDGSEWTLVGLQKLVEKGMKVALATELMSPEGQVLGVERWYGHSKLDLVTREPFGLVITDHKVKLELEKKRLEYQIRDMDPSWQLLHQAWAVRSMYGECPKWARAHMIALGPRPFTYVHSIGPLDDKRLDDWAMSAEWHWGQMETQSNWDMCLPPMNTRSCWRYGRKCEFYPVCHQYGGDLQAASAEFEPATSETEE